MFERTGGYYLPLSIGAKVAYARSVSHLAEDLASERPTVMFAVPRVFENSPRALTRRSPNLRRRSAFSISWWRREGAPSAAKRASRIGSFSRCCTTASLARVLARLGAE